MALGVDSASNRNEYRESSWWVKGGWHVWLTTLPPSVSRLSRKCESLHGLLRDSFAIFTFTYIISIYCVLGLFSGYLIPISAGTLAILTQTFPASLVDPGKYRGSTSIVPRPLSCRSLHLCQVNGKGTLFPCEVDPLSPRHGTFSGCE
jgi:hypothetical protein